MSDRGFEEGRLSARAVEGAAHVPPGPHRKVPTDPLSRPSGRTG